MNRLVGLTLAAACVLTAAAGRPLDAAAAQPLQTAAPNIDWNLNAEQIRTTCGSAISAARARERALVVHAGANTFASVVRPLEDLTADLNDSTVAQTFLFSVASAKDVRDASLRCNSDEAAFLTELSASPALYARVAAAQRGGTARNVYDRKLADLWLDTFKRSGAGLPAAQRVQFVKYSKRLTDLQNAFQANLATTKRR